MFICSYTCMTVYNTVYSCMRIQKYAICNKGNQHILKGLLAIKRSGIYEAQTCLKNAAREFKSESELQDLIDVDNYSDDLNYIHSDSDNDSDCTSE